MGTATTQIIISGKDQLSSVVADAGRRMGTELQSMQRNVLNLQNAFVALAGAAALGQIRQTYGQYDAALRDMGKVTEESMGVIAAKIGEVPAELGNATELIQGYYQVISAGITEPVKAMDTLTSSTEAAKSAHVAQAEVIKGITKMMAGYAGDVKTAADAADLLFTIEKQGQTSFAELIPVIGDVAAISKQLGVEQQEMGAALASVTLTAGSTSQAATQYRMMLVNLMKPTKEMQAALDALGASSGQAAIEQFGLAGTLARLQEYATSSGKSVAKLFESSEALLSVAALSRNEFAQYNVNIQAMEQRAGAADKAFQKWKESTQAVDDLFRNTMTNTLIKIGNEVMPSVNVAVRDFAEYISAHDDEIAGVFGDMADFGQQIGTSLIPALKGVGDALTQSIIPGIAGVTRGANDLLSLVPSDYQSAVGGGLIGYALLGPKGALIGATISGIKVALDDLWGNDAAANQAGNIDRVLKGAEERLSVAKSKLAIAEGNFQSGSGRSKDVVLAQAEVDRVQKFISKLSAAKVEVIGVEKTFSDTWMAIEKKSMEGVFNVSTGMQSLATPPVFAAGVFGEGPDKKAVAKAKKAHEAMLEDGKNAGLALETYWSDYENRRVEAIVGGVEARAAAEAKNLELVTEFSEKYRAAVLGETEFKLAQISIQAEAYRAAGADEVAVRQWAESEKMRFSRNWEDGARIGLAEYANSATNAAQIAQDAIVGGFQGMEDALVSFVTTGKLEFSDLANSIISDLARVAIQQSIMAPLASGLGSVIGGLFGPLGSIVGGLFGGASSAAGLGIAGELSSFMSLNAKGNVYESPGLHAYANSIVSSPTVFPFARGIGLMGEAGPEAIMPLKRGPDGVLGVSGGAPQIIINQVEDRSRAGQIERRNEGGTTVIDMFVEQIVNKLAFDINRGHGAVPAAITKSYGLSRSPGAY